MNNAVRVLFEIRDKETTEAKLYFPISNACNEKTG